MKKTILIALFLIYSATIAFTQMQVAQDPALGKAILKTGIIHSPLPLDFSQSLEAQGLKKKVLYSEPLCDLSDMSQWRHIGIGTISHSMDQTISGTGSIKLEYPPMIEEVPGPYSPYGDCSADYVINGANWEKFNRISFFIYPDCEGARNLHMSLVYGNDGKQKVPDEYNREGVHYINLVNRQWNHCFLEINEYGRDKVVKLEFSAPAFGKDRTTGDVMKFYLDKIELQQIEDPEIATGWTPGNNRIVYSTTGYALNSNKTAIVNMDKNKKVNQFQLIDSSTGKAVFSAPIKQEKTTIGDFNVLDFSAFNQTGSYKLKVGDIETASFQIGENLWENSLWRVLNFVFCERCGYAVPDNHSTCHVDVFAEHDGKSICYAGGWHDAGDLSQQTLQTGDVTYTLLEAYNKLKDKNEMLAMRLLEEAEWGLEFILKCRFGDGYRASSVGNILWTDGIIGTPDDIKTARSHNAAFDNFLYAAYEAYAAMTIDRDPMLQEALLRIAKEDFGFAMKRHEAVGYGDFPLRMEHSYNTPESQYMAAISWSASMLYKLTKDPYYAKIATDYIQYTLDCQRKEPLNDKDKIRGFFYRDKTKKVVVHYTHQSRDQQYMQAILLLCETQPEHPDYNKWVEAIQLHGEYLKKLMQYTAPYGMISSGVYHMDEANDPSFNVLHPSMANSPKHDFMNQLKKGVQLDKEHYLKRFPVWFSFRGNAAVHLSTGKSAVLCGKFLNDKELVDIGQEQLYWMVGKNPFGQSFIYGEGHNYAQQFSPLPGEIVGEVPVGMQTRYNEDTPYWPQSNNATYKEVWMSSAGKWISLAIEY